MIFVQFSLLLDSFMSTVYLKSEDILLLQPLKSTQHFQHHPAVLSSSLLSGPYRSKLSPFSKPLINRPSPRKSSTTDPAFSAPMMGYTESKHIAEHTHAYIRQQTLSALPPPSAEYARLHAGPVLEGSTVVWNE